jgi:hypothetical protein
MVIELFVLLQQSVFAEEILYDFDGLPTTFPTAVFGPPTASGHKSGILRFFPIRALDGDLLYHIHFEDVDISFQSRDGDLELYHHADAGGWFVESIDGNPFSLDQWMIERLFYSDDSGDIKPLVVDGYLENVLVASVKLDNGTQGLYRLPDEFHKIDKFEVYFDTWRGRKPDDTNSNTGSGGSIEWDIIIDDMVVHTLDNIPPQTDGIFPQEGMWWNPARSGHGIDIEYDGANLAIAWYTYNEDGSPTWYLASGPFSGTNWTAQLDTFTWDGTKADGSSVGTATLKLTDKTHATFSWVIDGVAGNEPVEYFVTSNKTTAQDYTGLWFEPAKSGYGLTVSNQGDAEFSILYFYDDQGKPRWVLGVKGDSDTYILEQFTNGFCPICSLTVPDHTSAGTITRSFTNASKGILSTDIQLSGPLSGDWKVNNAQIINLSNP